ncbi:hypothetical protein QYC27_10545 [Thermosynechococcus sp. PP45]|uniref:hypothetical protein n=1 Tax=unclassified Thermosynechococcus TaxID=2622553 RepID=UPI002671732E|nr:MULTISPECIES: hypothetical protein [unclassified Thermosynechococcus]WKT80723.1 hypothetical protein QYC27_10545 [Thermosynechococcus sp. PP45]WNC24334.1 hypothetical protein RHH26_10540 [Thermosynechococcus sp. PP551]WNC26912.1 hypothetical protein RHH27_10535 [Thermosynechococcus sp. PP555]
MEPQFNDQGIDLEEAWRLEHLFAVPAIWYPWMNEEEWEEEVRRMLTRSKATHDFIDGKIDPEDFACVLAETGVAEPYELASRWEEGFSFLTASYLL